MPRALNLRTVSGFAALHVQDRLLTEEDEKLPFTRHVISITKRFNIVEDFISGVFMRTKEVVVSKTKGRDYSWLR